MRSQSGSSSMVVRGSLSISSSLLARISKSPQMRVSPRTTLISTLSSLRGHACPSGSNACIASA